ncbi:carboxypeptidase-like regulatory domain-containing protein [Aquimarina mytili]|uniref:Carboxypeptidase-like regulatory domain-containing protein n=1 Tax=Aquimarina mytili TaxID=874423 RepID=A0A937A073_9FLAO|nr:carboxypeptidase-like regulatory domain-containing protein [Aquimarina mytili]MBL0685581.1 carboxypeptidase-like regulatory domain-containing protein [Aquimarina mytili]
MMHKRILFSLFFFATTLISYSQYEVLVDAFVINQDTNKPIPYLNIGFVNKGVGTVSDEKGRFYLRYDEDKIKDNDVLRLSGKGYESQNITYKKLLALLNKSNRIFLEPTDINIDTSMKPSFVEAESKLDSIGYVSYDSNVVSYWKDKNALGSELGAYIKSQNRDAKLLNLRFNIEENTADSLLVRVNIYKIDNDQPGENIVNKNILHSISRKSGEESIDLSTYDIIVNQDFIASIELVKVYGKNLKFAITGSTIGHSFTKKTSQDPWSFQKSTGVAFKMNTLTSLLPVDSNKHEKPQQITIYWDASLSMKDKNIAKEIQLLTQYFSEIIDVNIELVTFSNSTVKTKSFTVKNGNSKALIDHLKTIKYNGATNFSNPFQENGNTDQYLVFTDGNYNYGKPKFIHHAPVFYISSKVDTNHSELYQAANFTGGKYVNLLRTEPQEALTHIFNGWDDPILYKNIEESSQLVKGVVLSENTPVEGCKVFVKGTLIATETDSNGSFSIKANADQVLSFQHFSMKSKEIMLNDSKDLRIELSPKYEKLSEVTLKQKKKDKPEKKIYLGNRSMEKDKMGFTAYMITKEEFPPSALHFTDLLKGEFPGVQVLGFGDSAKILVRGRNTILGDNDALFVIDGAIQTRPPFYLLPSMIESITLIPGLSATTFYGGRARNGTFVIKTNLIPSLTSDNESKNTLLVKGNDYNESIFLLNPNQNRPEYLDPLWNSTSYAKALEIYYELRETYINDVTFYVFCSEYFKRWDSKFSIEVISNLTEIIEDNYWALRTLAFLLEERGDVRQAAIIYENLFDLRPHFAQSYLDLARIYKENKEYAKAYDMYKKTLEEFQYIEGLTEVRKQVKSEIQYLLNHHRLYIPYNDIPEELLVVKGVPVRIVFDWNDPQAEFEFQFVNPEKKYQKWIRRFDDSDESLKQEVKHGITSKEFIVDNSVPGEWIINIKSYDDASKLNPTFMKYTIYRNFGLPNETKEMKFIKLYNQKEKVTLDRFSI